ncbi:MAG TPA: hypothetical protein VFM45_11330 [Anaeromyxobacteraceae bacterium]|nr:hypothetical protein [Anaeromyxobacteraceae bacterium]
MRTRAAIAPALAFALPLALLSAACSRGGAPAQGTATNGPAASAAASAARSAAPFDWERPVAALRLDADAVAARLGSFAWEGTAAWSATRGDRKVAVSERHAVRQLATGEFEASGTIDPGRGPGSDSGKRVAWVGNTTYARSLYPASGEWRERPTDHGRGARRFRDESFLLAGEVATLLGPALVAAPAGSSSALGRPARRFSLSFDRSRFTPGPSRLSAEPPAGGPDGPTATRLAFLDGREPIDASGEMLLDSATGAPLAVRISALLGVKGDPDARVRVDVEGRVTALGGEVPAVERPRNALPDERKPRGVARALEQAGFRKKKGVESPTAPSGDAAPPEPVDEADEEGDE